MRVLGILVLFIYISFGSFVAMLVAAYQFDSVYHTAWMGFVFFTACLVGFGSLALSILTQWQEGKSTGRVLAVGIVVIYVALGSLVAAALSADWLTFHGYPISGFFTLLAALFIGSCGVGSLIRTKLPSPSA
jgi:hypothetical protein